MWNNPRAAPEYQTGWRRKAILNNVPDKILGWYADRVVLADSKLIENNLSNILSIAWRRVLNTRQTALQGQLLQYASQMHCNNSLLAQPLGTNKYKPEKT